MVRVRNRWIANAHRRGVPPEILEELDIAHDLGEFAELEGLTSFSDARHKCYFLLPTSIDPERARRAAVLTYIVNAGVDYVGEMDQAPFGVDEVDRIIARQRANLATYTWLLPFIHRRGGRAVTTAYGTLVATSADPLTRLLSSRGGTTWGDLFLLNLKPANPVDALRAFAEGKRRLSTDELLHHEERHSRQWAEHGPIVFPARYALGQVNATLHGRRTNGFEVEAGLSDGGYRAS